MDAKNCEKLKAATKEYAQTLLGPNWKVVLLGLTLLSLLRAARRHRRYRMFVTAAYAHRHGAGQGACHHAGHGKCAHHHGHCGHHHQPASVEVSAAD